MKMDAVGYSKRSVIMYQTTRCHSNLEHLVVFRIAIWPNLITRPNQLLKQSQFLFSEGITLSVSSLIELVRFHLHLKMETDNVHLSKTFPEPLNSLA